jgi:hypothetical protein
MQPRDDKSSPIDVRDVIGLVGLGLIAYGSHLVYPPAAFFVPGIILVGVAIFGVRR